MTQLFYDLTKRRIEERQHCRHSLAETKKGGAVKTKSLHRPARIYEN